MLKIALLIRLNCEVETKFLQKKMSEMSGYVLEDLSLILPN